MMRYYLLVLADNLRVITNEHKHTAKSNLDQ